jgi:hypothetical protein
MAAHAKAAPRQGKTAQGAEQVIRGREWRVGAS